MTTSLERVQRGARLLDELFPTWYTRIDCDTLWMGSYTLCVLGQLYGFFKPDVLARLSINTTEHEHRDYGFNTCLGSPLDPVEEFRQLTNAWLSEILQRRGQTA